MQKFLISSLILIAVGFSLLAIPEASALPVSYNTTTINLGLSSSVRNSSSYDVFTLNQDNWLWEKFDNNTIDSGPLSVAGTITYNTNAKAVYHFENVITDSSTNARTLAKAAGTQTFVSGHEGQGISLDGSTYYTGSDTGLQSGNGAWSVSAWIYPTSASQRGIFSWGTNAGNQGIDITLSSTSHVAIDNISSNLLVTTNTVSLNTWTHVVVTYDGTTMKVYFNGVVDPTTATPSALNIVLSGATGEKVGANITGIINFIGTVDELRPYNTALSLAQVQALDMVGHYSQSHTFDGGEYVSLGNTMGFERTNPFSISTWIKTPTGGSGNIFTKGLAQSGGPAYGAFEGIYGAGIVDFDLTGSDLTGLRVAALSTAINDNNWHYLAITYDGSSSPSGIKIYIDGISQTLTTEVNNLDSSIITTNPFIIGVRTDLNSPFTGQIDNMKVYPYALSSSQITSDYNSISPISSGKQYMSWYHGVSGSSTLTNKIGPGSASLTLACSPSSTFQYLIGYNQNISYLCQGNPATFYFNNVMSNTNTIIWHAPTAAGSSTLLTPFVSKAKLMTFSLDDGATAYITTSSGNTSSLGGPSAETMSNQRVNMNLGMFKYHFNGTALVSSSGTDCDLLFLPTNITKSIDSIACDRSVPANTVRYWNGMNIQGSAIYYTNSTKSFLTSIDNAQYKKLLSLPCVILVNETPCETFIMTDFNNKDYFVVLTATHVYYRAASEANSLLLNENYALQSYDVVTPVTTSAFEIPNNPLLQSMTLYGFNVNQTLTKTGLFTIPSGYTFRSTVVTPSVRLIDPRWTNDATDIPTIYTTSSLFPIFLTASNAPSFAAIKVTQGSQVINGLESVYAVAQLDSTRSVEFDLPPGVCANIYIADISVSPTIWNFQGIICATGVNQKTVAYTNTVPFTFYTLKYGVTDSFTPSNNGLTTTFRTSSAPTTYTVIIRNATGTTAVNQTFTIPANQTIDTRNFNVSSVSKPASLSVTVGGNQVYSAYLGSSLSLASVASFFHQYFNYQGFDLLSFIPVIFAASFTRNTVGAGIVMVVLMIATLSWLSVTVVPEPVVYVSVFVGVLSLVGYRSVYG